MAEYIDKQTALEIIASFRTPYRKEVRVEDVYDAMSKAETVEIIHCKDCIHRRDVVVCPMTDISLNVSYAQDDYHCNFAERREDA